MEPHPAFAALRESEGLLRGLCGEGDRPGSMPREDDPIDLCRRRRELTARRSFAWVGAGTDAYPGRACVQPGFLPDAPMRTRDTGVPGGGRASRYSRGEGFGGPFRDRLAGAPRPAAAAEGRGRPGK